MNSKSSKIRPAMTAIAAVIAFSTPSFAQSADPPATETPSPAAESPPPIVPDPVATEPAATTAEPATTTADPLTPSAAETPAAATPVARRATVARPSAARPRQAPARVANAAPAAPVAPAAIAAAPVAQAPAGEPLPVQPEAAPVVEPAETVDPGSTSNMLPAVAAGGLALLALAGLALVMRRRRRRAEEAEEAQLRDAHLATIDGEPGMHLEPEPDPELEPAMAFDPAPAPAPMHPDPTFAAAPPPVADPDPAREIDQPVADIPEGANVAPGSRVEAAYAGPSPDNPSLSLQKRLKRAAFFDQREMLVEAGEATPMAEDAGLPEALDAPEPSTSRDPV